MHKGVLEAVCVFRLIPCCTEENGEGVIIDFKMTTLGTGCYVSLIALYGTHILFASNNIAEN